MTAALIIAISAFLIPRFGGGDNDNARRSVVSGFDAAVQLRDQEQGWSANLDALTARTARITWTDTVSDDDQTVSVGVFGVDGETLALAAWNGTSECWMVRADAASGVPDAVWAVEIMDSSAGCTASAANLSARVDPEAPGRGAEPNTPLELG